ncbi:hypothetical protein QVD17_18345 [Tagetes erecta]|uniref:Uncharacterized protein n=1 Tax=Tagetes erecta TaxID=13708 RepID=A0AAD8KKF9_TARER|nr:hypothetical protein QVD17_18345 [Tagetes erecta]
MSNQNIIFETTLYYLSMTTKYAFPSHVSVQSFVTVKLNDKHMYNIWKTQMLSLLESHDMLEYVNESNLVMKAGDERNRRDALVRGWILGSISEHAAIAVLNSLKSKQTCFTAKHVWDQVQSMHGHKDVGEEERKKRNYGIERNYGMVTKMHGHKDAEGEEERKKGSYGIDVIKKVNEDREISRKNESLYHALECGKLEEVASILENEKDRVTDIISINGNTVLHIAVAYISNSDEFLKSLLNMLPSDIPLKDVRNVDGSTPLHLAASHWNINAAKILLDRSRDLLYAKDKEDCTPLDIVLSQPRNKEMCLFLMEQQANTPFDAHEPLLNAISYKHFDLALDFLQRCNSFKSRVILMAIAQNCPADFTPNQLLIYELSRTPVLQLITRGASNMKTCKKFASLVTKAALAYPYKFFIKIYMQFQAFKDLKKRMDELNDARELLDVVCLLIKFSKEGEVAAMDFYTDAMLEAIRRDASDVVEIIVFWFPKAALIVDEDGHNIAQWKTLRVRDLIGLIRTC